MPPTQSPAESNPLLESGVFPAFDRIRAEHVAPAMRQILDELDGALRNLEAHAQPTWEGLVEPLERLGDRLRVTWGIVGHLMGVKNSETLRAAYEDMQPAVVQFFMRLGQSQAIYRTLQELRDGDAWHACDATQQRIVEVLLRDAELSGVGLQGEKKERFNAIQQELAELSTQFSNHVLDATKAFALTLDDPQDVAGLPTSLLHVTAQAAREAGTPDATAQSGPWRITLDYPSFMPFMAHSRRRDLREQLYRASITRASSGELDNAPLIARILQLRQEMAALLGYGSFAELSLASKMAPDVSTVESFLEELRQASLAAAQQDLEDQQQCAAAAGAPEAADLRHWDLPFWAERRREQAYDFSEEALRPYFPLPRVLDGLFALARRLFGVRIEAADGVPVWHEDVQFFRIYDEHGREIAAFYLDPYSRPAEKRGGAWMDECVGRSRLLAPSGQPVRLPVAYLICNQTPPVGDQPSLMSFTELRTLFHEFGHGLHHMLTAIDPRHGGGHQQRGLGCRGTAEPVHGELVLPPRNATRHERARGNRRAAAGRPVRQALRRPALPRRAASCCANFPSASSTWPCTIATTRTARKAPSTCNGGWRRSPACCPPFPKTASCAASGTSLPAATRPATTATSGPRS